MSDRNCDKSALCSVYTLLCSVAFLCYLLSIKALQHNTASHHMDLVFWMCIYVKIDKWEEPLFGCTTDWLHSFNGADPLFVEEQLVPLRRW